jgi:hypothetical protein
MNRKRLLEELEESSDSDEGEAIAAICHAELVAETRSRSKRHGSRPGKSQTFERNFQLGHDSLMRDYLGESPVYSERDFETRFRMPRAVFDKLTLRIIGKGYCLGESTGLESQAYIQSNVSLLHCACWRTGSLQIL